MTRTDLVGDRRVAGEMVFMSYAPKLAAALSGGTIRQLANWRTPGPDGRPVLTPEHSTLRPIEYSFRDVIALRTWRSLRPEASLRKVRRAFDALRMDRGLREHLSSCRLVADGSTITLVGEDQEVDLVAREGNLVIHELVDVLAPFYVKGHEIPALLEPRKHVQIDPDVRGGEPVIAGTRVPYDEVAALLRDGVSAEEVSEFYPQVSPEAAKDALDFGTYVDSYVQTTEKVA